jgi:hypothetical protein
VGVTYILQPICFSLSSSYIYWYLRFFFACSFLRCQTSEKHEPTCVKPTTIISVLHFASSLRPCLQVARWGNLIEHIHIHTCTKAVSTWINGILTYAIHQSSFSVLRSHYAPYSKLIIGSIRCRSLDIRTFFIMAKCLNKKWTEFWISYFDKFSSRGLKWANSEIWRNRKELTGKGSVQGRIFLPSPPVEEFKFLIIFET